MLARSSRTVAIRLTSAGRRLGGRSEALVEARRRGVIRSQAWRSVARARAAVARAAPPGGVGEEARRRRRRGRGRSSAMRAWRPGTAPVPAAPRGVATRGMPAAMASRALKRTPLPMRRGTVSTQAWARRRARSGAERAPVTSTRGPARRRTAGAGSRPARTSDASGTRCPDAGHDLPYQPLAGVHVGPVVQLAGEEDDRARGGGRRRGGLDVHPVGDHQGAQPGDDRFQGGGVFGRDGEADVGRGGVEGFAGPQAPGLHGGVGGAGPARGTPGVDPGGGLLQAVLGVVAVEDQGGGPAPGRGAPGFGLQGRGSRAGSRPPRTPPAARRRSRALAGAGAGGRRRPGSAGALPCPPARRRGRAGGPGACAGARERSTTCRQRRGVGSGVADASSVRLGVLDVRIEGKEVDLVPGRRGPAGGGSCAGRCPGAGARGAGG